VRRREAKVREAAAALDALAAIPLEVYPSQPMMPAAFEIACTTGRTVYDSVYLALAVLKECPLVTADRKLYDALGAGRFARRLLWITEVPHA
jgi:predicted nucleic acid-binding protein